MKKLIIIGNGFDLAHGYKTTFKDFITAKFSPELNKFKNIIGQYVFDEDVEWYMFEKAIRQYTYDQYNEIICNDKNVDELSNVNLLFSNIELQLQEYLREVQDSTKFDAIESIKNIVSSNDIVISYNYTDLVKNYWSDVYYINGSLEENNIIIGFDQRIDTEFSFSQVTENMKTRKRFVRNLGRYLLNKGLSADKQMMCEFDTESFGLFSNRGEFSREYENKLLSVNSVVNEYINSNACHDIPDSVMSNLVNVEDIVIIGHSMECDIDDFQEIFSACKSVMNVTIFVRNITDTNNKKKEKLINDMLPHAYIHFKTYR